MSHLDKPLGTQAAADGKRRGIGVWFGVAAVLLVIAGGVAVWLGLDRGPVEDGTTRIALGDESVVEAPTPPISTEPGTVVIDGLTVRKLSPLEGDEDLAPTDEPDGAASAPVRPSVQRVEPV
ncbi:MAG: hypothetical protein AAFO70_02415, partial [Pseudomonadota bacterium]